MKTEQTLMNERSTPVYYWELDTPQQGPKPQEKDNGLRNDNSSNKYQY